MLSSGMSAITYNSWLLRLTPSVLPHSLCLCYFCAWVCLVMCNRYVCEFACDYIWCVSLFFFLSLFMLKIGCNVSLVCISRLFGLFQSFLPRIFKALRLFNLSTYISPSFVSVHHLFASFLSLFILSHFIQFVVDYFDEWFLYF